MACFPDKSDGKPATHFDFEQEQEGIKNSAAKVTRGTVLARIGSFTQETFLTTVDTDAASSQLAIMNENILRRLSSAHLRRAAAIREQIEQKEKELAALLGIPEALTVGAMVKRHRNISAATRAKLSAAAKAHWAKMKGRKS